MSETSVAYRRFWVIRAQCGQLPVVLGSATARDLYQVSFADILNEEADTGYQRPFDSLHAREFRSYIEQPSATTIPLTFNLRGSEGAAWTLEKAGAGRWALQVPVPAVASEAVMAQVDCQHRLGMMSDCDIELTFQCYLGLSVKEEMAIFNVINGKAKGLSSSLLDYHTTKLVDGYEHSQLELYIANRLNEDPASVWRGTVKLGGAGTQGSKRRISLRGLQSATKLLLKASPLGAALLEPSRKYSVVRDYWQAVAMTWPSAWANPRQHLVTKGVGVTALSLLGGDITTACFSLRRAPAYDLFREYLSPLKGIDWSASGAFKGFGGRQGASQAHEYLRSRLFSPGLAFEQTS